MTAADGGQFLASHADRERVIDALKTAFTEGRLTQDELEGRVAWAAGSRTYAELAAVMADIPVVCAAVPRPARKVRGIGALAVFGAVPPVLLVAAFLADSKDLAAAGLVLFILDFLVAMMAGMVAIGTAIDSRRKNRRARGQPPPRPGLSGGVRAV